MSKKKAKSTISKDDRVKKTIRLFQRYYPEAHCALHHKNPLELLIATSLSAQCTDARVNIVTQSLFKKYNTAEDYSKAPLKELEQDIRSTGFYKNKAKNLKSCCTDLVNKFNSQVPESMEELTSLAGVGRKTANVVIGNAFHRPSGVVVDTHVTRISNRLGLVKSKNAVIIERELNELLPKKNWIQFSHWMIHHGRNVCKARKPQCDKCFLDDICPKKL